MICSARKSFAPGRTLTPGSMANLSLWIWRGFARRTAGLAQVVVHRHGSGNTCRCSGPKGVRR